MPTRKVPRQLAIINADNCTGCEACVEVCPVDCILTLSRGPGVKGIDVWCEIDLERCIGCELCVRLPRKRSDPYELTVCPWNAIELVATEHVVGLVMEIGVRQDDNERRAQVLRDAARRMMDRSLAANAAKGG